MRFNKINRFVAAALLAALVLTSGPAFASAPAPAGKVNLNTATVSQLEDLPGIGPAMAQRIIEFRETEGAFTSIEDIKKVKGIGEAKFEKMKDKICI